MSRPLRLEFAGAVYHVTSRGERREPIYRDDEDRRQHLAVLEDALERFDAEVLAYCLMGNHYHLVMHTRRANLSRLMRHLNGVYTQRFNRRHGLSGHLFQGRFKALLVDRDAYLLALCRYVERNPVAAGIVRDAGDWPWSSYSAHVLAAQGPAWLDVDGLHGYLLGRPVRNGADAQRAAALYARMVREASDAKLWQQALRQQVFLGDETFVERMLQQHGAHAKHAAEVPRRQRRIPRSLGSYLEGSESQGHGLRAAVIEGGYTMTEVAKHVGLSVSRVSRLVAAVGVGAKGRT
jgi:putative transposase